MVTITDRAREHVRKLINDNKMGDVHLRFSVTGGGCSGFNYNLTFAKEPEAGDQVLEYGGLRIFVEKRIRVVTAESAAISVSGSSHGVSGGNGNGPHG